MFGKKDRIMEFKEFVKSLTDMELVALLKDAKEIDDKETSDLILSELGIRQDKQQPPDEAGG